ncbi:hypothetical protein LPJ61_002334 [Coemansia biformis]|uniref:Metallo-beta-lactamase domain-containing protein n=1 Tax=Coemansia biformis TaxID=1286918 RepID=A0A9W7YF79_9FUNG|nr:hypothetical protein LPJ61_002334 [Coemansia biformis]
MTAEGSKNRRRNSSLLVCADHPDGRQRNILIDCGKSFYASATDIFIKHDIDTIDAVLLTHGHADAMFGLDDLRAWTGRNGRPLPVYCDQETLDSVACAFPYLVNAAMATGSGVVSQLEFKLIEDLSRPVEIEGVEFLPLPVEHGFYSDGRPYYCNGYRFGDVSYLSDCSKIIDTTRPLITGSQLIVLDALTPTLLSSHFGYEEAVDEARKFRAPRMLLTDISHHLEHGELERRAKKLLAEEGLVVDPAYDGLVVDL